MRSAAGLAPALIVLLVAFNLRGALIAVAPVMDQVRRDTGLSTASAGLLLTLPVLCFAAFAPLAPPLARRWGIERVLAVAMALLSTGVLVRLAAGDLALFAGTVGIGAAIAVGNVLLPALVKRDFAGSIGMMTGAYVTVMSAGAALAAATTILIERATPLDWRGTLALWAVPAAAALLACLWRRSLRGRPADVPLVRVPVGAMYRDPLARQVTLFMGIQSLIFYSCVAWVPTLYIDRGFSPEHAGVLFGVMNLVGLPATLAAPVLAGRRRSQTHLVIGTSALGGAGLLGLTLAPAAAPMVWMVLLGLGQGSAFGLALAIIGLRAPDSAHAAELSGMAQSVGYLIAAAGPFALGAIHGLTGSWTVAFLATVAALVLQVTSGLAAGRDRYVGGPRPT